MSAPKQRKHGFFSVGGPAFNGMLVVVLGALSAVVVASPSRADELDTRELADVAREPGVETGGVAGVPGVLTRSAPPAGAGSDPTSPGGTAGGTTSGGANPSGGPAGTGSVAKGSVGTRAGWGALNNAAGTFPTTTTTKPASNGSSGGAATGSSGRSGQSAPTARATSCEDFATQPDAQAAFDTDRAGHINLDGDGDGRACEGLPGTPPAPTTSTTAPPSSTTPPPSTPTPVKRWECKDFPTQPEAQYAYDRDPYGFGQLDGDGDGRACEGLPGTPPETAPPTTSTDPYVVPTKAQLMAPTDTYYGFHTLEAPWFFGEVDQLSRLVGKAPNTVLFFQNFTQPFPAKAVSDTWARHAMPIIAWEPILPGSNTGQPKLADITNGNFDAYLDSWAADIRASGQPVVIRLAAEMNGDWYSWAEGAYGNAPGDYVAAWRHVHDRFAAAGTDNVIWLWSANRIDHQETPLAQVYPGDAYVDWVGMSGYYRNTENAPTFDSTFGATLAALRSLTTKPIFLSETGAGSGDTDKDLSWMDSFFQNLPLHSDVVGFSWFNEKKTLNDWRLQRGQGYVDRFATGIADGRYGGGKLPAGMMPGQRVTLPEAREESAPSTTTTTAAAGAPDGSADGDGIGQSTSTTSSTTPPSTTTTTTAPSTTTTTTAPSTTTTTTTTTT